MSNQTDPTVREQKPQEATPAPQTESTVPIEGEEANSLKQKVADLTAELTTTNEALKRARDLQSIADRKARQEVIEKRKVEAELRRIQAGEEPVVPQIGEEISGTAIAQKVLVKGLVAETILRNKNYQKVLEQDPTLQEVLLANPLAIVEDAIDAEDALNQIKEKLDLRVETLKASQKKMEQPKGGAAEFSAGPVNVPEGTPPEVKTPSKKALEEGDIEKSILSKIKIS